MKKILILLMPLFFLVPFVVSAEVISTQEPYDYKSGLLDDENLIDVITKNNNVYDNDINTFDKRISHNSAFLVVRFKYVTNIKGMFLHLNAVENAQLQVYSVDNNGDVDIFLYDEIFNGYTSLNINNVIRIEVRPTSIEEWPIDVKLNEIDFFGNYNKTIMSEYHPDYVPIEIEVEEVKNIIVETEPGRVNLSWELPRTEHFEHVNIYRKDLGNNEQETSMFNFLKPMKVHASNDDFRAIFETNGTYFNDLTVEENSKYEYKLTTEYQGIESQGVIVQAETGLSPAPPLEGGGGEQQANGDYLFKWASPREGQVRIFVDGNEYATVEASTGQLLVPSSDMKYSALGKPLISYQTIGLNGEESNIISPDIGDLEIPVTPGDVIETGSQLIGIVSSFILLGLSFIFAPKLIKFIRQSFSNKKEDSDRGREREQRESRTSIRETRQPRQGRTRTRTARTYREGRA